MTKKITRKVKKPRKRWLGWHFADETEKLSHGDGRKIKVGITHAVKCKPVLCESGLHASKTVLEALPYAPGLILYRVELLGDRVDGNNKSVATKRKYLARINATNLLREFARKCALEVVHLWDCPRIVREYLETGDKIKRDAARDAAKAAAGDAAGPVAKDAAWSAAASAGAASAAWSAAAAWAAARAAAGEATEDAWAAAWIAAWNARSKMLESMALKAMKLKA